MFGLSLFPDPTRNVFMSVLAEDEFAPVLLVRLPAAI